MNPAENTKNGTAPTVNNSLHQYPAQNVKALEDTPAHIIAGIAAQLQINDMPLAERVRMAFELLDTAESGIKGLKKLGCHHTGINEHISAQAEFEDEKAEQETLINSPYIQNDRVAFEKAMSFLFSRGVEKKDRPAKFALYVAECYLPSEEDHALITDFSKEGISERIFAAINGEKKDPSPTIEKWKQEGIPADFFIKARKEFPDWWKAYVSHQRSVAGKQSKKGKQGKVRSNKDKRQGARV